MSPSPQTRPPDAPLPDARLQNWVDRRAPEALKPWLKLGRIDRPIGIWLLLLPGWQGLALGGALSPQRFGLESAWWFAAFAIGAALMRAAGCAWNDIVDRDIDAQVARTRNRPLASGQISVKQAWGFIALCLMGSVLVLLTLNLAVLVLAVVSLGLVLVYPFMKRITWWPQAWLGLTFNWGALMGFAAASGGVAVLGVLAALPMVIADPSPGWQLAPGAFGAWPSLAALMLYVGGVFWTLGYDTIYALQDIEDDALVGVKSSARRLGPQVRRGMAIFYAFALIFAVLAGTMAGLGVIFYLGCGLYGAHFIWQLSRLRLDDPRLALDLFKSNLGAGLLLLGAIIAATWIGA